MTYAYDPAGNVTNMASVAGKTDYAFDAAERLSAIDAPRASFKFAFNPYNGLADANAYDNGITARYTHDVADRLTDIRYTNASGTVLFGASNLFNDANMITNIAWHNGEQVHYTYDSLDRFTGETRLDSNDNVLFSATYQYDLAGNRINTVIDGVSETYVLGEGNRLASWGTAGQMHYDAAGSVTQIVYSASSSVQFERNDRYQVTATYTNGTLAETYGYDALGRRVFVGQGAVTNYHVYDGVHVVADVTPAGALVRSYTYGPGIDNILSITDHTSASPITYYYLTDHLGSVHAIADVNGTIVERYEYDAWGNVRVFDGTGAELAASAIGNRYTFQGREISWATRLEYFRARWYDGVTGRWLSRDPIGIAGGLNLYAFCQNSPTTLRDPSGCDPQSHVVHHIESDGRVVYSGEAFVEYYLNRMTTKAPNDQFAPWQGFSPFHVLGDVLSDPLIDIGENPQYSDAEFCWRGKEYSASEMGNIAAGYVTVFLWGPINSSVAMWIAEGASFLDSKNFGRTPAEIWRDVYGSLSRNNIGMVDALRDQRRGRHR